MEDAARHLVFHAVIVLLIGLLTGIPYGRAILKRASERSIEAWRVAHLALPIGAILMFVLAFGLSGLTQSTTLQWTIALLFIISGYGFALALVIGPITGFRGLTSKGPFIAKVVYLGNIVGAITSLLGTLVLLYVSWLNL